MKLSPAFEKETKNLREDILSISSGLLNGNKSRNKSLQIKSWTLSESHWKNLFASLSAISLEGVNANSELKMGDWNPLSQRVALGSTALSSALFAQNFVNRQHMYTTAIVMCHESLHLALWEPFFTGQLKIKNKKEFKRAALLFEAVGFFEADIVCTGRIRDRFKELSLVFSRVAVSQNTFHPSLAFAEMGIKDPKQILKFYLAAFLGEAPKTNNFLGATLYKHFHNFHNDSSPCLDRLWDVLSDQKFFSEYYQRFCKRGLPALFKFNHKDLDSYAVDYKNSILKPIAKLSEEEVELVRRRRAVQTRAYYAMQVRYLLSKQKIVKVNNRRQLISAVKSYLDSLEHTLAKLSDANLWSQLSVIDHSWNESVRRQFLRSKSMVAERKIIFPSLPVATYSIFLKSFSKQKRFQLWKQLSAKNSAVGENPTRPFTELEQIQVAKDLVGLLSSKDLGSILKKKTIAQLWTLNPSVINPVKNEFRELPFSYG